MTSFFPANLQAFRIGVPSLLTASSPVRLACALPKPAQRILSKSAISTINFRPRPQLSSNFRHAVYQYTAARQLSSLSPLFAQQVEHRPPDQEKDTASADADVVDDTSPLTKAQLNTIFGQEIDHEGAAELLSRLQSQRREGKLDEGLPYPTRLRERGLEYLRSKYPIDEDAAIIARLDMELDGYWSLPQMNPEKSPTGRSGLDEIRKINQAKRDKEDAQMEAELKELKLKHLKREKKEAKRKVKEKLIASRQEHSGRALVSQSEAVKSLQRPSEHASGKTLVTSSEANERRMQRIDGWIKKSNERVAQLRAEATADYLPQMTRWQRLWRSGLFTFGIVGVGLAFARFYDPPSLDARLFPDLSPAAASVGTIIAINALLFTMWRVPHAWKTMNRYFLVVPAIPRAFSMLGAEFSHQKWLHLTANMIAMWLLGTQGTF